MNLSITNFRGLSQADIDLNGQITLLAGRNGAGKSSACLALAALLTGEVNPISLRKGGDKNIAVLRGAKEGSATLSGDGWSVSITWPDGERYAEGDALSASRIATGLDAWTDLKEDERQKLFADVFKVRPDKEDLKAGLVEVGHENRLEEIWARIAKSGWPITATWASEEARDAKGAFRQATGEQYGAEKAAKWLAVEANDLAGDASALKAELDELRIARDRAVAAAGVAKHSANQIAEAEQRLHAVNDKLTKARAGHAGASERHAAASATLTRLRSLPKPPLSCPGCGTCLKLDDGQLVETIEAGPFVDLEELAKAEREEADAAKGLDRARNELQVLQADKARLEPLASRASPERNAEAEQEAADLAARIAGMEGQLRSLERYTTAKDAHERVATYSALAEVLGDKGVRKTKAVRVLELVNGRLADLSTAMGGGIVSLDRDMAVHMGELPLRALSQSERWRALAIVQMLISQQDGSHLVILDGADVLDQGGRNGLVKALRSIGLPAVIGMTVNKPELAPDLAKAGLGASYWISDGTAAPIGADMARAA